MRVDCDSFTFHCSFSIDDNFPFRFQQLAIQSPIEVNTNQRERSLFLSFENKKRETRAVGVGNNFIIHRCNYVTFSCLYDCASPSSVSRWFTCNVSNTNWKKLTRFSFEIKFRLDAFEVTLRRQTRRFKRLSRMIVNGTLNNRLAFHLSLSPLRQVQG